MDDFGRSSGFCPPELQSRLVPLDGGRFATSDLNDLYRRVINRNNRLEEADGAARAGRPSCAMKSACFRKRWTRCSITAAAGPRSCAAPTTAPLKSLSDTLKGKQGSLPPEPARQACGLFPDARSSSSAPSLKTAPVRPAQEDGASNCSSPSSTTGLEAQGHCTTIKQAKEMVEQQDPRRLGHPRRSDSRTSGAAQPRSPRCIASASRRFEPVLVEGKAIRIHPLVLHCVQRRFRRRPRWPCTSRFHPRRKWRLRC